MRVRGSADDDRLVVRLVRAGGVLFFGGGESFADDVFLGGGRVAFGSCTDIARLVGRCERMKSITIPQTINMRGRNRKE